MKKLYPVLFILLVTSFWVNAQTWQMLGTGGNGLNPSSYILSIVTDASENVYAAGSFTDGSGKLEIAKWNGTNWSELGTGIAPNNPAQFVPNYILTLDVVGSTVYAGGSFFNTTDTLNYVAGWTGSAWNEVGAGVNAFEDNGYFESICHFGSNVYAATSEGQVYKWNGTTTTEVGTQVYTSNLDYQIGAICADATGNLYIGGNFTDSSGYNYVARWDGTNWVELGIDNNALNATGNIVTMCTDATGNVYAAGSFADNNSTAYVAKWNGSTWSELGTGVNALNANNQIQHICADAQGNIYAAGGFTNTSGNYYVAKWNGTTWSELGPGSLNATGVINSIAVDIAGDIYAAVSFDTTLDGIGYVAKYNSGASAINQLDNPTPVITAFPNPAFTSLSVQISQALVGTHYSFFDNMGRQVSSGILSNPSNRLDVSQLASGLYLLKIQETGESVKVLKGE